MFQSQQRSTDLCTDSYINSTQDSFCGGNCLRSKLWISYGGGDTLVPCVALGYTSPYAVRRSGRLRIFILYTLYFTDPYLFYYALPVRQMS
jgi:hypothetical protein